MLSSSRFQLGLICGPKPRRDTFRCSRVTIRSLKRGNDAPDQDDGRQPSTSNKPSLQASLSHAIDGFMDMSAAQKAWALAACLVAVIAIPRALVLILIAAERLVVGSLLATEALLAGLLLRSAAVGGAVVVVGLVIWGLYAFVLSGEKGKSP